MFFSKTEAVMLADSASAPSLAKIFDASSQEKALTIRSSREREGSCTFVFHAGSLDRTAKNSGVTNDIADRITAFCSSFSCLLTRTIAS